ncbi:MAG: sec-independent protein translocase protein TatA [Bacteroidia bacterium]|jgi:sec-independent protein translocase protein TatA
MGFGIKELVVILVIVLLLFGTKKLKGIGSDLGGAIKGFKKSMTDDNSEKVDADETPKPTEPDQINSENKDKSA